MFMTGCLGSTTTTHKVDSTLRHPEPLKDYWEATGVVQTNGDVNWLFIAWWVPLLIIGILIAIRMFRKEGVHKN
jgi:hypothetical protein